MLMRTLLLCLLLLIIAIRNGNSEGSTTETGILIPPQIPQKLHKHYVTYPPKIRRSLQKFYSEEATLARRNLEAQRNQIQSVLSEHETFLKSTTDTQVFSNRIKQIMLSVDPEYKGKQYMNLIATLYPTMRLDDETSRALINLMSTAIDKNWECARTCAYIAGQNNIRLMLPLMKKKLEGTAGRALPLAQSCARMGDQESLEILIDKCDNPKPPNAVNEYYRSLIFTKRPEVVEFLLDKLHDDSIAYESYTGQKFPHCSYAAKTLSAMVKDFPEVQTNHEVGNLEVIVKCRKWALENPNYELID